MAQGGCTAASEGQLVLLGEDVGLGVLGVLAKLVERALDARADRSLACL